MLHSSPSPSSFSRSLPRMSWRAGALGNVMTSEYFIGLLVAIGLLVYLAAALLHPEKF
jgi:K+-transporting ATPase KdpF subunit